MTEPMRTVDIATATGHGDDAVGIRIGGAVAAIREAVTIATVLRTLGALATVLSLSLYLMQGFEARGHLERVYVLLGQSGLLALAGLAVGYVLKEAKGARVFLTLALASVPANVAVLGAMVYSIAPLDGLLPGTAAALEGDYPAYAFWEASGPGDLLRALLPGAALLVPVTLFGFSVLARRFAGSLSFALLASSALLLVPLRDPLATALLGGAMLIVPILSLRRAKATSERRARPATFEERLAGALLLLPSLILVGRATLGHGTLDAHAALPLLLGLWYVLHRTAGGGTGASRWRHLAALGSGVTGTLSALLIVSLSATLASTFLVLPLFALISGALFLVTSRAVDASPIRRSLGVLWSASVLIGLGLYLLGSSLTGWHPLLGIACALGTASLVLVHGVLEGGRGRTLMGALAVVTVLWMEGGGIVAMIVSGGWATLCGLGVTAILAGSLVERFGPALRLRFSRDRDDADGARDGERAPAGAADERSEPGAIAA